MISTAPESSSFDSGLKWISIRPWDLVPFRATPLATTDFVLISALR